MKTPLSDILGKKLIAAILAMLLSLFGEKLGAEEDAIEQTTAVLMAYIVGQGIADAGKERAKVEKKAPAKKKVTR